MREVALTHLRELTALWYATSDIEARRRIDEQRKALRALLNTMQRPNYRPRRKQR